MVNGRRGSRGIRIVKPSALCEGGPRDGWGYFVTELEQRARIEIDLNGRQFWYRPTARQVEHPRTFGEVLSQVWEYVEELDPFAPKPPPPPTKLMLVREAVAMCGRNGGQLGDIVRNLPPELTAGSHLNNLAVAIAPLVWWLTHQGVIEQSSTHPWYERRYRSVRDAQRPTA